MYSIGYDIGSSSIKAALVDLGTGETKVVKSYPRSEMKMAVAQEGWAEQDPDVWWDAVCMATKAILAKGSINPKDIKSIGISYQMHGLVCIDKNQQLVRPAIIWCDSRAVGIGEKAKEDLGEKYCFGNLLNSPGNFTASKLKWVKENEPEIYERIDKVMLPGDYIALRLTSELATTIPGLSEAMLWNFDQHKIADKLLDYYAIDGDCIPPLTATFGSQGHVSQAASAATGLPTTAVLSYRAGDQPNNAMSLGVLQPGQIAATGGTSGVVYGLTDQLAADPQQRINSFAHVNHHEKQTRIGQLLCINGAGSQYAWIRQQMAARDITYADLEIRASEIPVGAEGLRILPFGNGAERMLQNKLTGGQINNLQFNLHRKEHFYRAALEGIAFSFVYGILILQKLGVAPKTIRVGNDNLFQSTIFSRCISNLIGCNIEMMNVTGAVGAAKASGIAIGAYKSIEEAVATAQIAKIYAPGNEIDPYKSAYQVWEQDLKKLLFTNS